MPNTAELLAQAKSLHTAGRLAEAVALYEQVVAVEPSHQEAHYLLGLSRFGLNQLPAAAIDFEQAVRLSPQHAEARHYLGAVLARQGRLDEAIASLQQAWQLNPRSEKVANDLRHLLAVKENQVAAALTQQGRLEEAVSSYHRAIELKPDFAEAHNDLGALLRKQGHAEAAVNCYRRAAELKPDLAEAHYNLGVVAADREQWDDAIASYRRALQFKPEFAQAHNNLGAVLQKQRRFDEAVACYRRTLELKSDHAGALNNLGVVLSAQGHLDEAVASYRRGLEINPDAAESNNNLGTALQRLGNIEEAESFHRRAAALKPDFADAHNDLGAALAQQRKFEEAAECWRRALELQPDHAPSHHNRALALLLLGRLAEAWGDYEWRFKLKDHREPTCAVPRWQGEDLAGRRILLRCEQGMGDILQFVRYAELVKRRGGAVIVECQAPVARLIASCPGVEEVVVQGQPLPPIDAYLPIVSLPGVFGTTLETIPARVGYLEPDAELVAHWKAELDEPAAFKIGIAWHGNPAHPQNRVRSFPLSHFAGIARRSGVRLYSLQWGAGREQLADWTGETPIIDLGDRLGDFYNTAAIVRNLDLVITCDSAPAHLAGALRAPVWVALTYVPDWRWMLDRADSPWYPTMRLFRQAHRGDWAGVFAAMEESLAQIRPELAANDSSR